MCTERFPQRGADRGRVVARQIERGLSASAWRRYHNVVFEAAHQVRGGRFGGLHPTTALLTQAKRRAMLAEALVRSVEVQRQQVLRMNTALRKRFLERRALFRRHREFEFDFMYGESVAKGNLYGTGSFLQTAERNMIVVLPGV